MTQGAEVIAGSTDAGELLVQDIQQLGQRLVAEAARLDLNKIIESLSPEQIALLRYASDVLLRTAECAEALQSPLPTKEAVALHSIPAARRAENSVAADAIPEARHAERRASSSAQVVSDRPVSTPQEKPGDSEAPIQPTGAALVKDLLKDKTFDCTRLTAEQGEQFIEAVISIKTNAPRVSRPTLPVQYERLRLKMSGKSYPEIAELTGATSSAVVQGISGIIQSVHRLRGGSPAELRVLLEAITGNQPAAEPELLTEAAPNTAIGTTPDVPIEEDLVAAEQAPAFSEDMEALCEPYWSEEDRTSLLGLLDGSIGQGDEAARFHIRQLLACFAPHQGDGEVLDRIEWDALNYLTGYRFNQQGQKILSWSMLRVRMHQSYELAGKTQEEVFAAGFGKLIRRAAKEYAGGWYPLDKPEEKEPVVIARPVTEARTDVEELPEDARLHQLLEKIVHLGRISPLHVSPLEAHLTGNGELKQGDARLAQQGLAILSQMLREADLKSRGNYYGGSSRKKGGLTTTELRVMGWLAGNKTTGLAAEPYARLVKSEKVRQLGIAPEALPKVIRKAIAKIVKDA